MGVDKVTDGMVDDWGATLDALSQLDTIDANRIAYMGFSMGTRFGLPYVAAAGDRLRCAVLGKNGMRQTSAMPKRSIWRLDSNRMRPPLSYRSCSTFSGMTNCSRATGSSSYST